MQRGMAAAMRTIRQDPSVLEHRIKPGTLRRTLEVAAPYTGWLLVLALVVVANSAVSVAYPLIYRRIIDDGILKTDTALIVRMAVLIAALGVADAALGLAQTYLGTRIGADVVVGLRTRLFEHIQRMPLAFFARTQTGALVSRLFTDTMGARSAFTDILSTVAGNIVTVVLIIGTMFVLSWRITVIVLIVLPLFVLPARYWGRRIQSNTREIMNTGSAVSSMMVERFNVAGAMLAKLFGRPDADRDAFEAKARELSGLAIRAALYGRLLATALLLMASLATALAYGWGGVLAARHALDLGTVVALTSLLVRLYAPVMGLSNLQVTVMTALVAFERVFEVLELEPMVREKPGAVDVPAGPIGVVFEHVAFRYPSAAEVSLASLESISVPERRAPQTVLHDIDLNIAPGTLVALVGPSGAGKTTITQLIPRLYDVTEGAVRINGIDVRDARLASLQQRIGVVTQEAHLFHDTLRANLLYARPQASDEQLREALRDAQILDVVEGLSEGLDTVVGERGYRFSGGEKQRLAIARLLLKAPDLVVLDEATAHLDSRSEAAVQQALERALTGRTAIVIAHRLSTVLKADQILVVQDGRIVQRGSHAQLASAPGLYEQLYRTQFASQASSPGMAG
ncbi:MAG TPA: ABC transporter ATP-binding protein [Steroidobacteraceae bacterium]|nr:ABC transporter ATP-binding protein [Steroidobacteraceae bacterium]